MIVQVTVNFKGKNYISKSRFYKKHNDKEKRMAIFYCKEELEDKIRQLLLDDYWGSEDERMDREHTILERLRKTMKINTYLK
jgi:hypothetical protein